MCEILAEILVRNAYLVRNADRTIVKALRAERAVRQSE